VRGLKAIPIGSSYGVDQRFWVLDTGKFLRSVLKSVRSRLVASIFFHSIMFSRLRLFGHDLDPVGVLPLFA